MCRFELRDYHCGSAFEMSLHPRNSFSCSDLQCPGVVFTKRVSVSLCGERRALTFHFVCSQNRNQILRFAAHSLLTTYPQIKVLYSDTYSM